MYKLIFQYPSVYSFMSDSLRNTLHEVKFEVYSPMYFDK